MHELARIAGLTDASGAWYLFWSGVFGDVSIFAGVAIFLRHHNCHHKGCWRLGRQVHGTPHVACRQHHTMYSKENANG